MTPNVSLRRFFFLQGYTFILIDPMGSPPRQQERGLYRTERFCGVLVAVGFLPPARSFISEGTSNAECRRDKPRTFAFDFRGAAFGATGAMSRGFFAGRGSFPMFCQVGMVVFGSNCGKTG